ncbi:MAG: DNA polymerase III subunit beta [Patescibacteria group bacterium]
MVIQLLSENLQNKLGLVSHATSTRSQLPILSNFLIKAKDGKLYISATDLEIGIEVQIQAKIEEEGSVTVPAKTFLELLNNIPSGKISLTTTKEGLELKGEKIRTLFQTIPSEEFPKIYEEKGTEVMIIKKEDIVNDFGRVVFAAGQDQSRTALSGVLVESTVGEDGLGFLFVATDGYRLSLKRNITKEEKLKKTKEGISILVPARVVRELIAISKDGEDMRVYVSKEKNQIMFCQEEIMLVGRLIEAEFPDYKKIIPQDFSTKASFIREEMLRAVRACYVFSKETAGIVKLSVLKNKIVVSANTPSVGENTIEVEAKTQGEENEIAFNARYLLDILSNVEEDEVSFEMTGPLNPGVFKIENDNSFLHLIMPIRVQA